MEANFRDVCFCALSIVLLLMLLVVPLQAQETDTRRVALLIGNSAYENVPALRNPGNDSTDLAAALRDVGFEVTLHTDQTQGSMLDSLRSFSRSAAGAEVALIYYAGHGIEINRQNYLIPVDAVLETDADINFEAVPLETMILAADGAKQLSMVIVDACRNNPFSASIEKTSSSRSIGRGLSAVEPSNNTLVAYAAKEGTTAADGVGRNSPYALALINSLRQPNLEVGLMMRRVRDEVLDSTNGAQEPFVYGSLSAEQIFLNDTRGLSPVEQDEPVQAGTDATAADIAFWQSVSDTSTASELERYLERYPDGLFVDLARARLGRIAVVDDQPENPIVPLAPQATPAQPEIAIPDQEVARDLTRDEIVELQQRLTVLGYALGQADGILGRRTEAAIRAFMQSENLPLSGEPGLPVLAALRERVSDTDLANWRTQQASARAAARAKAQRTRTKTPRTQTKAPAPVIQTPAQETKASPSNSFKQFCASNRQCSTLECRVGSSELSWRKSKKCRFCPLYVQRCQ